MKLFNYKNISIKFNEKAVLKYIAKHLKYSDCETGGMICGYYTEDLSQAVITEFCEPPRDSILKKSSFIRGILGAKKYFIEKWEKGQYYLGDWHLHPYSQPTASDQDLQQLRINAKDKQLQCPEPIMVIIGGSNNDEINVYIYLEQKVIKCEHIEVGN